MNGEQRQRLEAQVMAGGQAYVRNLAASEAAVMRGQFNLAKVLRALGHSQRAWALGAARRLATADAPATTLEANLLQLERSPVGDVAPTQARERAQDIARRSMQSLRDHSDVPESDVAQFLCGCHTCGNLIEITSAAPDACDVCGALSPELEWFEPFYSITPEHLGQRRPEEIMTMLAATPDGVAAAVAGVDDATLRRKPSPEDWCAKEIVAHILETELLFGRRANAILAHDGPGLPSIASPTPPWKLHEGKGYGEMPMEAIVTHLRETRADTLALLRPLTSVDWARRGSNVEGTATVLDLGTWLANHDLGHLVHLRRVCGRPESPPVGV